MDSGRPQQPDKKQLLQQQQLQLQKQLQQQQQHQQLLKQQQQQQQLNNHQQQFKQQQQQLRPQQQVSQTQQNSQQQQPILQAQPQYLQQQQLLIRNQDFMKQRGMQQGHSNQQQLLEHQKNQDKAVFELLQLHDNNGYEVKSQEDRLIVQQQQRIQQQQKPSLQRQLLQSQVLQQSQLGQLPQFLQQSQQQFQNVQQLQNLQQPQLITQPQILPKTQVEHQPQVVRQTQTVQKPNSLQQSQTVQQQNNQFVPVSTQQQSKNQPPPHTQQLLQQQLQQLLLKNKNYPQRIVVLGNQPHQQQLSPQQPQRVVSNNSNGQQPQQMQCVVVSNTGQQPQQMQRVVVTGTGQQQIQRVVVANNSQPQSQQIQRVVVPTTIQHQQMQRVVITGTGQQIQQQQIQHVVIPSTSQQQSHNLQNVVTQTSVQQQPQQMQRLVVAPSGQQQIQRVVTSTSAQHQTMTQRIVIGQLKTSQQTQQTQSPSPNRVNQLQQLPIGAKQQQQRVVIAGQQQILKLTNQQQSQKQIAHKLFHPTSQQQQDVIMNQQQQAPHQQLSQGNIVPLTQQQKNKLKITNESLVNELHIKQSHQQLQQLHVQPSQKHSQQQINKQLQQQKLKQKKEIDQLQHQLIQPQRSEVILEQLQQPIEREPKKLEQQLQTQKQQRKKQLEGILLQQKKQKQQQLKELQQKHQQQLREQVLLQQHLKQQQQQKQLEERLLLKNRASSENRLSIVVNENQDQKIQDEEKTINCCKKQVVLEPLRAIENAAEKELSSSSSSSSSDEDDDETIREQRTLLREAERLVQERYDALMVVLGSKYQAQYDEILRNWLASRLSREEFNREIRKVLYVSWVSMTKNADVNNSINRGINASGKTNNTAASKKTAKKDAVTTKTKLTEETASKIKVTAHKSPTFKILNEINEEVNVDIDKKEAAVILAERLPLHNALVNSLITWMPLNCKWLEQRKARAQGISETGSPLRLYTYADVPQARGPSDHWFPDVHGSLSHWYWPNYLPFKSSLIDNNGSPSPKESFHEQEEKEIADAVAATVLLKPPSRKLLPLLMKVAADTETVRRKRQIQYKNKFPKIQNLKVAKRLQWQRLQEQKRLATQVRLRDGCSKMLLEVKAHLSYLVTQEHRLIKWLRRLKIRVLRRQRQLMVVNKNLMQEFKSRMDKFFDRSYIENPNNLTQEKLYSDATTIENEKEFQHNLKPNLSEKNHGKKKDLLRLNVPQSSALMIRLSREKQRLLNITRLLNIIKKERIQVSSFADYVREIRNKNCPCGESNGRPCQYRKQIRQIRKKLRIQELEEIKAKIDRELVKKTVEKEKENVTVHQKTTTINIEKKQQIENKKKKVVKKSTKKKRAVATKKNTNVQEKLKKGLSTTKSNITNKSSTITNKIKKNSILTKPECSAVDNTITKNAVSNALQASGNLHHVNKRIHNVTTNCELLRDESLLNTRLDTLGDTRNRLRSSLQKDKRSVVNVADAAARAAQAALAALKKTQIRKSRAAAAATAAAATAAIAASGGDDNDRRASELMPPPPPPASPKTRTTPRNPTIGARYLQQQQFLLDRHRQLGRIQTDEEDRQQNDQYDYGDGDYDSSDEESSGSSCIEPPFPPLLHDLRIDQLPRPTNRVPAAAVLPPGVRKKHKPTPPSNSKIQDVELSNSYRKPEFERLQERNIAETRFRQNTNELFDSMKLNMRSSPLNLQSMVDKCKNTEPMMPCPPCKNLPTKMRLQTEFIKQRGQQQQAKINDINMSQVTQKCRQDAEKLSGMKNTLESATIISSTITNPYTKEQLKRPAAQLHQYSTNKIIRSISPNRNQELGTKLDVEELRSVQWKAPLTQWNKRPVAYEIATKQGQLIQKKNKDLNNPMKEKLVSSPLAEFEVSEDQLLNRQDKSHSEIERQICARDKLQILLFEYRELVDVLPKNERLYHMKRLQENLRLADNTFENTNIECNLSVEQQKLAVASTNKPFVLLDDEPPLSPPLLHLSDDDDEKHTLLKKICSLLLKIKHQKVEMYQKYVNFDNIKHQPEIVSNIPDVHCSMVQNELNNWYDLWPAYEDKQNNDVLIDEEQRLCQTQELIDQYHSSNNYQKSVRSLPQQKRRLGQYARERLEKELPEYQKLRITQIMQSETPARSNLTEHLPGHQKCLEQYKRLGLVEQLKHHKPFLEHHQQPLVKQNMKKLQNEQQSTGGNPIQQQQSLYWMISKLQVSSTLCYDEKLPLHDQFLRKVIDNKCSRLFKIYQQQHHPKSTAMPITLTKPEFILPGDTLNTNSMSQMNRGSQFWWMRIGIPRQISPLVKGIENQHDLKLTHRAMIPIGNLPQVTRPQTKTKAASVIDTHPKGNATFINKMKLKKLLTPQLLKMMTIVEKKWLEQLQAKILQLDQQVKEHWKAMIDGQQKQVNLLLHSDKYQQFQKEKNRQERERRIQQLMKRKPVPVHYQPKQTLRVAGDMWKQKSEIPTIIIDDDGPLDETIVVGQKQNSTSTGNTWKSPSELTTIVIDDDEPLDDSIVVGPKRESRLLPVFINYDDNLQIYKTDTKVLYKDQHKLIINPWKQLDVIRVKHQQQWKLKLKKLFIYKAKNIEFCKKLNERLMRQIKNPHLIIALEKLNGGPLKYIKKPVSELQPTQEPRILDRHQKQVVKIHSQPTPKIQESPNNAILKKPLRHLDEFQGSILTPGLQRPLNIPAELGKQLPQKLYEHNKNQPKKSDEHRESVAVNQRLLRSKQSAIINQPPQKRTNPLNHQKQNKHPLEKKESQVEKQKQVKHQKKPAKQIPRRRLQSGKIVRSQAKSSMDVLRLNNKSFKVTSKMQGPNNKKYEKRSVISKLILDKLLNALKTQELSLQGQLNKFTEDRADTIQKHLDRSISNTLIISHLKSSTTSLVYPQLLPSTINQQSSASIVTLSLQQPFTSIQQPAVILTPNLPNEPTASTSKPFEPCIPNQLVIEKFQALRQHLNVVQSKLQPLIKLKQFSIHMTGNSCLLENLGFIEKYKQYYSDETMLDSESRSDCQQKYKKHQSNESPMTTKETVSSQLLSNYIQQIRKYLSNRQQQTHDLLKDFLIMNYPDKYSSSFRNSQQHPTCSVLYKLQYQQSMTEQTNPTYSALLELTSPSFKQTQQELLTYSVLLKLKNLMTVKKLPLPYSIKLKLQKPPMPKQISLISPMITTRELSTPKQQPSIALVSDNLPQNSTTSNNKQAQCLKDQHQEKRRLSSGNESDNCCKKLKSSPKNKFKSSSNSISNMRAVPYSLTKTKAIDKNLPIFEILDSDSSNESSQEASFGVQVSDKSPLTIKIIKKKPVSLTPILILKDNINTPIKLIENKNKDINKHLEKLEIEEGNKVEMVHIEDKREDFKKFKLNTDDNDKIMNAKEENCKNVISEMFVFTTIASRPTQIDVLVSTPKEALAVVSKATECVTVGSNQICKVAAIESPSSNISHVDSKCLSLVPDCRKSAKLMCVVENLSNATYTERTISASSKLTESVVDIIVRNPIPKASNQQPEIIGKPVPTINPIENSNMKMMESTKKHQYNENITKITKNINKSGVITTNHRRRLEMASNPETLRQHRPLISTVTLDTRGPPVPIFQDHGFAEGTTERVVHGWFMTTIMAMSTAHTIASYIPPRLPRIPLDYHVIKEYGINSENGIKNRNVHNTHDIQSIKSANSPITLSTIKHRLEKAVKTSNIGCGNDNVLNGCARSNGSTLMSLPKVTKEAIGQNTATQARATSASHLTTGVNTSTIIPAKPSPLETTNVSTQSAIKGETIKSEFTNTNTSTTITSSTLMNTGQCEEHIESVKPLNRSKSAVIFTPVTEAATVSSDNFKRSRPIKRSASMASLSPPSSTKISTTQTALRKTSTSPTVTIKHRPNAADPGTRASSTLNTLKTISPTIILASTPNDVIKNVLNNSVYRTDDEGDTIHQKTNTITNGEQRTVTVTRTLCPTIPAPMDVSADACALVTAACTQYIKSMLIERSLKASNTGTLQLHRRDKFSAAVAGDDDIRPFPNYHRISSVGTTIVHPATTVDARGNNDHIETSPASESTSIITDSKSNTKSIIITTYEPDDHNEWPAVSKQQSIIVNSKSNKELSVMTVKTVVETETTTSLATALKKLQCPATTITVSSDKTRSSSSVYDGTSARTRGEVILKKTKCLVSKTETPKPSISEIPTTDKRLPSDSTVAGKRKMCRQPVIGSKIMVKHLSDTVEPTVAITKTRPVSIPDTTLAFKKSTLTRGFFVQRGRPLLRPTFHRRQPFGTLVATCIMAAADTTAVNNGTSMIFLDDRVKDLDYRSNYDLNHETWGCYFGCQQMLPPSSKLDNFSNAAQPVPSYQSSTISSNELAEDNHLFEQMSLANSQQQLMISMEINRQQRLDDLKKKLEEYKEQEPYTDEEVYQQFMELQGPELQPSLSPDSNCIVN